jgi:MinD superfamily P-loop ATPase
MIISIASGKGGTGKTTVAVSLALSLENVLLLDCDVEEPNAHLFLTQKMGKKRPVFVPVPRVDEKLCNYCGKCSEICAYNAIAVLKDKVLIFPELCHSCGGCSLLCPENAIFETKKEIGTIESSRNGNSIAFVQGRLRVGEARSAPLVSEVKKEIGIERDTIIDAPPGTACSVIESIKKSDFCILVTEPTPFGLHDLTLAVEMLKKIKIPFGVVINRSDLGDSRVENYCCKEKIPILMQIPFSRDIAVAYSKGKPIIEEKPEYRDKFKKLFHSIEKQIQEN